MSHQSSSPPPRYSLDTSDSQLDHEGDITQEFLKQNEILSQEIWKCDKSLYCPTRTFKVLACLYLLTFLIYLYYFLNDQTTEIGGSLPKHLFYAHFILTLFCYLMATWACTVSWRVIYSKDPLKLNKPILIFKSYFCFVAGIEAPVFVYYMTKIGWSYGFKLYKMSLASLVCDTLLAACSTLLALRIKNILLRHKPFHEASSFYVNSNASFAHYQRV